MSALTPAKVFGNDCEALAKELMQQPELLAGIFSEDEKPAAPLAVKQYNGERSTLDEEKMLMVGALRVLGATDREIERHCHVTRRTIPVMMAELERTKRVTPLKERLLRIVGDTAERSGMALRQLLEDALDGRRSQDLAAMIRSVGTVHDFAVKNHQLLTGQATEILETREAVSRDALESWWREKAVPVAAEVTTVNPANELESLGSATKPQQNDSVLPPDTQLDTTTTPPTPGAAGAADQSGARPGGGMGAPAVAAKADAFTPS